MPVALINCGAVAANAAAICANPVQGPVASQACKGLEIRHRIAAKAKEANQ